MSEWQRPNHHRVITTVLVLLNLVAVAYALYAGGAGQWDFHFRQASFITWLGSAQMLGAALLFLACYFAGSIIRIEGEEARDNHTWLVFAIGFFVLAADQQFLLREQLTALIDRVPYDQIKPGGTATVLKAAGVGIAIVLVIYYRATVLSNFSMVVAFIGGFWFLLVTLLGQTLVDATGLPVWSGKILQGSGKLLAMAMFLSGSYIVLLDRVGAAQAASLMRTGDRRRRQIPINFPDRRGQVEFRPIAISPPAEPAVPREDTERLSPLDQELPVAAEQAAATEPAAETASAPAEEKAASVEEKPAEEPKAPEGTAPKLLDGEPGPSPAPTEAAPSPSEPEAKPS